MNIINTWQFWVIVYIISAVTFAQNFKKANRNMKNAGSLTVLLEIFTLNFLIKSLTTPLDTDIQKALKSKTVPSLSKIIAWYFMVVV